MVAENNRVASRSVWDGTVAGSGVAADFTTLDFFRIEDGLVAEHWESVDWVRAYQSFGLLSDEVREQLVNAIGDFKKTFESGTQRREVNEAEAKAMEEGEEGQEAITVYKPKPADSSGEAAGL